MSEYSVDAFVVLAQSRHGLGQGLLVTMAVVAMETILCVTVHCCGVVHDTRDESQYSTRTPQYSTRTPQYSTSTSTQYSTRTPQYSTSTSTQYSTSTKTSHVCDTECTVQYILYSRTRTHLLAVIIPFVCQHIQPISLLQTL